MRDSKSNAPSEARSDYAKSLRLATGKPIRVEYFTKPMSLPPSFLSQSPPADALGPINLSTIDFSLDTLPENKGRLALVLDNVLSPSECHTLISLAESSVDLDRLNTFWNTPGDANPWRPAMVNAGQGYEVLEPEYRNSDRIVWDSEELVARLWARCMQSDVGEALQTMLGELNGDDHAEVLGEKKKKGWSWERPARWVMTGLNRRMRFLRYGPGQFFRPHCDGNYSEKVGETVSKTFFTIHLYLNDSVAEAGEQVQLVGGATSFVANDGSSDRKVDVNPKAGRILIFQQQGLYHAGDDVLEGTKYTMRTEVMYELVEKAQWITNNA